MKRSTLVTLMLVIAAVMLAIGLFIAGSIWRGRASPTAVSFGQDAAISPPENSTNFVCCASSKGKPSVQPLKENRDQWRRIKKITSDLRIRTHPDFLMSAASLLVEGSWRLSDISEAHDCGDYCGDSTQTRLAILNKIQTTALILPCALGLEKSFYFCTFSLHFRYVHP